MKAGRASTRRAATTPTVISHRAPPARVLQSPSCLTPLPASRDGGESSCGGPGAWEDGCGGQRGLLSYLRHPGKSTGGGSRRLQRVAASSASCSRVHRFVWLWKYLGGPESAGGGGFSEGCLWLARWWSSGRASNSLQSLMRFKRALNPTRVLRRWTGTHQRSSCNDCFCFHNMLLAAGRRDPQVLRIQLLWVPRARRYSQPRRRRQR